MTDDEKAEKLQLTRLCEDRAKKLLKEGDRVGCTKCPGTKRIFTFVGWAGHWMLSKSGIDDLHPWNVYSVNGVPMDFKEGPQ